MIIKHTPEDFIVEEIPIKDWDDAGPFAVFKLKKTGLNTEHAIEIIAKKFHIPSSIIKYAGAKDRNAQTTQYVSIPTVNITVEHIKINEDNISLEHVGYSDEPLSLGMLKGNRFFITVREPSKKELEALKSKTIDNFIVPNYFDEQRFSSNNYRLGLCMIKKDYKKALEYLKESNSIYTDNIDLYLMAHPNDYIGMLRKIPRKTLLMFIHALQSYIYNEALARILLEHAEKEKIKHYIVDYSEGKFVFYKNPKDYEKIDATSLELIGFNTETMHHHIKSLMNDLSLTQREFIIRALPELSVEGTTRECFVNADNLNVRVLSEHVILEFELSKGSYATIVVKGLFSD